MVDELVENPLSSPPRGCLACPLTGREEPPSEVATGPDKRVGGLPSPARAERERAPRHTGEEVAVDGSQRALRAR